MFRLILCFSLLLATAVGAAERSKSALLDEIVAIVDLRETRVLLLSDLEIEARLSRARMKGGRALRDPVEKSELSAAFDRLINQLVIVDEAARLQLFEPTRTEIDAGVEALRTAAGPDSFDSFLSDFELEETVREIVRREVRYARYLESRFRLASKPRDSDVHAFIAARKERNPNEAGLSVSEVRDRLAKERFEQLSSAFVAEVRRRARLRVLHDPATPSGPTPLSGVATISDERAGAGK